MAAVRARDTRPVARRRWRRSLVALAALALGCRSAPGAPSSRAKPAATPPSHRTGAPLPLAFVEVTTGDVHGDEPAPLIVALHGLGDTPESFVGIFDGFPADARVVAPHSASRYSRGWAWFPPRGPPPSDDSASDIAAEADVVADFVDRVARARPTVGKPILMGFSQGGALTFAVGVRHPGSIGAAFPVGGWLPHALWPSTLPKDAPPIVAFHGTVDARVPLSGTRLAAARLAALGFAMDLREFDGVGHGIPLVVRQALWGELAKACAAASSR